MRFLIFLLIALSAGFGLTLLADSPGYVLISRQPWSIETSLIVFMLGLLAAFVIFYLAFRLLDNLLSSRAKLRRWQAQRNRVQAADDTCKGMTKMVIGHWAQAEKLLTKNREDSPQPVINLLAAAWIAQQNNNHNIRDDYLSEASALASSATEGSATAVGLVQCKLLVQAGDLEQALISARTLHTQTPANPAVIRSLVTLLTTTEQWQELLTVLASSNRYNALPEADLQSLQSDTAIKLLAASDNAVKVDDNWNVLHKNLRKQPGVIAAYCRALADVSKDKEAQALIRSTLKRQWSDELVDIYGLLNTENPSAQLKQAESWLSDHPTETPLMLCMGRLSIKNQLWGMARSYLELAVQNGDSHEAALELGWLYESLGETDAAISSYKKGLESSLGSRVQDFTVPTQTHVEPESVPSETEVDEKAQSPSLAYSNESK